MPEIYNAARESTGAYAKDRVVGTETFRILQAGVREGARDLAIARANWVDYAIRLANVEVLTTDAIRYALDQFRELEPDDEVPADQMRGVVEYMRRTSKTLEDELMADKAATAGRVWSEPGRVSASPIESYAGPADPQLRKRSEARADQLWEESREFQEQSLRASEITKFMERWSATWGGDDPHDTNPPKIYGEVIESDKSIAIFVSDFHMSDGTEGGDDFMTPHLSQQANGLVAGNPGGRVSKVTQFGQMITWVKQRIRQLFQTDVPFDLVLNGDIFDQLDLIGRGTQIGAAHKGFMTMCAGLQAENNGVIYVRGNHDFLPPPGPWTRAEAYSNPRLQVFAEHGDQWDRSNWPPGTGSFGAKVVTGGLSPGVPSLASLEALRTSLVSGPALFWLAGVDNVRPFADIGTMLKLRSSLGLLATIQDPVDLGVQLVAAYSSNDSAADQKGAARRRTVMGSGWLIVQGHTHVPIAIPGKFYNTGTWTPLVKVLKSFESSWYFWATQQPTGREDFVSIDPFLLTYASPTSGARVEEYYTILSSPVGSAIELRTPQQINSLYMSIYSDTLGVPTPVIPALQGP